MTVAERPGQVGLRRPFEKRHIPNLGMLCWLNRLRLLLGGPGGFSVLLVGTRRVIFRHATEAG